MKTSDSISHLVSHYFDSSRYEELLRRGLLFSSLALTLLVLVNNALHADMREPTLHGTALHAPMSPSIVYPAFDRVDRLSRDQRPTVFP